MGLKLLCFVSWSVGACVAQSRSWFFPGDEIRNYFLVPDFPLPAQFTIETWIQPTAVNTGNTKHWLSYAIPGNDDCMLVNTDHFAANVWQHVHITWDGIINELYIDGVAQGAVWSPATAACTENSAGALVIGQDQDTVGGGFGASQAPRMYLDTVAVYDQAWSASEVAAVAGRQCIDSGDPSLRGAWYDGPDDNSGNGYTAEISAETTHVSARGCCSGGGSCFHGDGTLLLESGSSKRFSELSLGDVIKTSDGKGSFFFKPVLTLPHANNSEPAAFLTLTTESGKTVDMTPDHFIPRCDKIEVTAGELNVGDCVLTVDGKETLMEISATSKDGVFTAITADKFIVVDGVVASPYSQLRDPRPNLTRERKHARKLAGASSGCG